MRTCLLLIAIANALSAQVDFSPASYRHGLDAPVERFVLTDQPFDVALRKLAALARPNAVIGFEPVIGGDEHRRLGIAREVKDGTVGLVLALMTAADDRYVYSEPRPGVIRVQPKVENPELAAILNLPIADSRIDVHDWPANVITHIAGFLPELGRYFQSKELEWSRKTGRPPPGSAGSILGGTVPPPEISVAQRNATVRGVLDAVAAFTLEHGSKTQFDDPWVPPTGWRVDFKLDPEAYTGLGGYVSWSRFP